MESSIPRSYSLPHLMRLAQAYSEGTGRSLSWIDTQVSGSRKLFARLARDPQAGMTSTSMARVSSWLDANWPADLPWPADVPRQSNGAL
jgi:hypothetical protein